jgi:hypothetical protein
VSKHPRRPSCRSESRVARAILAAALLALPLLGCSSRDEPEDDPLVHPVLSPNGEPLTGSRLGTRSCAEALETWQAKWGGRLAIQAYVADAEAQFRAMDLDRDGVLTSAELTQLRAQHRIERKENEERRARRRIEARATRTQTADPVMSADANLDFRVTRDEFLAYAQRRFRALDTNGNGTLDRAEIASSCALAR